MKMTPAETCALRDQLYFLDPDENSQKRALYEHWRNFYIGIAEGRMASAYKDVLGYVTVGIGFNMDRPEARDEWDLAFPKGTVSFDAVYSGGRLLDDFEMDTLFSSGLSLREKALKASYPFWSLLRANERLATESAYYNGVCLVRAPLWNSDGSLRQEGTRYYAHLKQYAEDGALDGLKNAVMELRDRSNRRQIYGLTLRRESEAILLSSFDIPGFSLKKAA